MLAILDTLPRRASQYTLRPCSRGPLSVSATLYEHMGNKKGLMILAMNIGLMLGL